MKSNFKNVAIPSSLYEKIEQKIKGTDFSSVDSFVTSVLAKIVAEDSEEQLSQEEEEQIRQRLQSLGYIE